MTPFISISCILISTILFYLVLRWKVTRDYNLWKANKAVKHGKSWRLLCLLLTPSVIILAIPLQYIFIFGIKLWMCGVLVTAPMLACIWWLTFDGWFNNKRKFNYWFTGSEDGSNDAIMDNILQGLSKWQHIAIKLFLIALFTSLYIIALL